MSGELKQFQQNALRHPRRSSFILLFLILFFPSLATAGPKIAFDSEVYQFAEVEAGIVISASFDVTNTGDTELVISDVKVTCDCTEAYENNNIRRVCQLCNGISIYRLHLRITFLCCLKFFDKADSKAQRRAKRAKTGGVLRARELLPREVWSVVLSFI